MDYLEQFLEWLKLAWVIVMDSYVRQASWDMLQIRVYRSLVICMLVNYRHIDVIVSLFLSTKWYSTLCSIYISQPLPISCTTTLNSLITTRMYHPRYRCTYCPKLPLSNPIQYLPLLHSSKFSNSSKYSIASSYPNTQLWKLIRLNVDTQYLCNIFMHYIGSVLLLYMSSDTWQLCGIVESSCRNEHMGNDVGRDSCRWGGRVGRIVVNWEDMCRLDYYSRDR